MARGLNLLTTKAVEAAKPGTTLNDGGGLHLRVSASGTGRWVLRFKLKGQPQREMGLGTFGPKGVTLALARQKATAARELVAVGVDPIRTAEVALEAAQAAETVAAAEASALTFGDYADKVFLPSVLPAFSNPAHIQQWKATFKTHAALLRPKKLAEITRKDVLAILLPIWTTKNITAYKCRQRLEKLFDHAIQNEAFAGDNPAEWRRLNADLSPSKKEPRKHHASVPHDEVAAFVAKLRTRQAEAVSALMLEFIILSACRTGEARFAVWSEIDLDKFVWSIPATRMKMRRDHDVPLTPRMVEILKAVRAIRMNDPAPADFVFPGPKPGKGLSEMACLMLMKRMGYKEFTGHGMRATFKTWAMTSTEFPRELIEEQLAHQLGAVERAYVRGNAVERRRVLMEAWEAHLNGVVPAGAGAVNVVPFKATVGGQA